MKAYYAHIIMPMSPILKCLVCYLKSRFRIRAFLVRMTQLDETIHEGIAWDTSRCYLFPLFFEMVSAKPAWRSCIIEALWATSARRQCVWWWMICLDRSARNGKLEIDDKAKFPTHITKTPVVLLPKQEKHRGSTREGMLELGDGMAGRVDGVSWIHKVLMPVSQPLKHVWGV